MCTKGFTQIEGVDYTNIFSPVVTRDSLRILLSCTAAKNWEIKQMDVTGAFLNGDLSEEIYCEQPEGFIDPLHRTKSGKC